MRGTGMPAGFDPDAAALAVVDPQRLFCDPASPAFLPDFPAIRPDLTALAAAFRARVRPVAVTRHAPREDDPDPAFAALFARRLTGDDPLAALIPPFRRMAGARRFDKPRFSIFSNPRVAEHLGGSRFLVLAGVTTHLCVLASCLDAAARELIPVVAADACCARDGRLHEAALAVIAAGHGFVAPTAAVVAALAPGGGGKPGR